ncbi:probable tetraacyldisaccharide 4'-kinase, mitochondrial [Salvia miltiorrhiza]|uniref:probable tetraacyldisaccharide 4'-kinase, mitochondrial n=1 Tax=Salvia miltiorrhiza TaxID=226208 RepID=UPI0025AC0E1A|nr:probable tetraacyldisaccharide 4'-kinase, mitochondrial [Salvia miltiorrhiza]XP_057795289.1 probable tetraacyldisaccharide 4'-kinase, mitochondrial [Salvia miltiorrhiza]
MEKLRRAVKEIAYTPHSQFLSNLSPFHLSLIPLLSLASSLYSVAVRLRRHLYRFNILQIHRLPVPVISVGNLTWGGNGKTPMVELLARSFAAAGISPLILTRGYGGADEAKMLQRQLQGTSAKIGVGANRVATALRFLEQFGFTSHAIFEELFCENKIEFKPSNDQIGVAILDDGMQHLSVRHDLEIVMVNALVPWGNHHLLPLGPLREPLTALCRADILVIHHADLVQEKDIDALKFTIRKANKSAPIFFTKMTPMYFFRCRDSCTKLSIMAVENATVLCLSGIGYADSFIQRIERMGPTFVDHLDFSDHHLFELQDLQVVRTRLEALESKFGAKPVVVVTEKDYDRAPDMLVRLKQYEVLVLCSRLQFLDYMESTEERFRKTVRQHLGQR